MILNELSFVLVNTGANRYRHTVPGHLPPPVRLGLGGQRRQGILFLPSGARGGSVLGKGLG
eukprot:scaffold7496_cov120-Isochrysis_galbana.AAC.2